MYENQKRVNAVILELAAKHNVKYIASNDAHFIMADDAEAHDRLIASIRARIWTIPPACGIRDRST